VLLAYDLDLSRPAEHVVERDYFAGIVERRDCLDLSGTDVDEAVGVESSVMRRYVERAGGVNDLNERVEGALVVGQLEPPLEWKPLPAPDVGEPDERPANASSRAGDSRLQDLGAADILVDRRPDDGIGRNGSIDINRSADAAPVRDRDYPIRLCGRSDDGRPGGDASGRVLTVACTGGSGIVAGARECREQNYCIAEKPAKHQMQVEVRRNDLKASDMPLHFTSYTGFPPIQVESTRAPRMSESLTRMMSRSSTTKSAYFPGVIEPITDSWNPACAAQIVMD